MKVETVHTSYQCDWCGVKMDSPINVIEAVHSTSVDWVNVCKVSLGGSIPYRTSAPDYCKDCAKNALVMALEELERQND